jgi:hypothetical protein
MIPSFAKMTPSDGLGIGAVMRQFIQDEPIFRRIEIGPNAQFLDWKKRRGASTGTSTIIEKTRRASKNQNGSRSSKVRSWSSRLID